MNIRVRMVWLAAAKLSDAPVISPAFNVLGQRGFFGQFEVAEGLWLDPRRFEPTVSFHEWATHRLFDGRSRRRAPYESFSINQSLNVVIEGIDSSVFPGHIALVRVTATATLNATGALDVDLAALQDLRSSKEIPIVRDLISLTLDRLTGDRAGTKQSRTYDDYFVMLVELPTAAVEFANDLSESAAHIVGLLIGTRNPKTLKSEVIDRTLSTNAELNSKSRDELMLLNRKGLLIVRPGGPYTGPHVDRLAKARDLAIMSQFAWLYLNCVQSGAIVRDPAAVDALRRIRRWVEQPELTFFASFSHTLTWMGLSRAMLLAKNLAAASESGTIS